jgi:hypothetical protein
VPIAALAKRGAQAPSNLPIFAAQTRHAPEFDDVVGDQKQIAANGLSGDQYVVGTDRSASGSQQRPDLASLPGIPGIEIDDLELNRV